MITCQCIRVPVLNGHTAAVFVKFRKNPTKEELINRLESFKGLPQELNLPSAPKQFMRYMEEDNRPQVTLDVDYENGMGISIGRLREDTVYDWKFIGLSIIQSEARQAEQCCARSFLRLRDISRQNNRMIWNMRRRRVLKETLKQDDQAPQFLRGLYQLTRRLKRTGMRNGGKENALYKVSV